MSCEDDKDGLGGDEVEKEGTKEILAAAAY